MSIKMSKEPTHSALCHRCSGGATGRTGEDTSPPSSLQDQFSNLSKSGEKNGGGGTFVTSVQLFRSNLTV